MRKNFVDVLNCPSCGGNSFKVGVEQQNTTEIREGYVSCNNCNINYRISKGILNILTNPNRITKSEQEGWKKYDLLPQALPFKVEDADRYEKQILALPEGDGNSIFKKATLFRNISDAASVFNQGLALLGLTGKEKLLDLGADICWSTNKFAELGCQCVALDVNHHLPVSDVYIYKNKVYFERIVADMSDLPFTDESFDIVVTVTSIHHTPDLEKTFKGIARVLDSRGKVLLINEPIRRILKSKIFGRKLTRELGINENWYTALEYYLAAKKAGLKLSFRLNIRPVAFSDEKWKKFAKNLLNRFHLIPKFANIPIIIQLVCPFSAIMIAHKQYEQ